MIVFLIAVGVLFAVSAVWLAVLPRFTRRGIAWQMNNNSIDGE
jgi:hypothetical protein